MQINTDYIEPAELTGYAREALADLEVNQFTLSAFLPSEAVDDLQYRFTRGGNGLAEAASYRSYDAESAIGRRQGTTRVTGELPPVSRKIRLGEYDRLRQRRATDAIVTALQDDTLNMVRAVAARVELARGSALSAGKVIINEDGVIAEVDFGRRASHSGQAPAALWSNAATATPIADLLAWHRTYKATNGGRAAGAILTSDLVRTWMLRSQEVRALAQFNGVTPSIIAPSVLDTLLVSYGLPPLVINDAQVAVEGVATRLIPESNVILVAAAGTPDLGGTFLGTTAESLEAAYGLEEAPEGIVAGVYSTDDPVALWTKAAAVALPTLANPDLTFQAVVL